MMDGLTMDTMDTATSHPGRRGSMPLFWFLVTVLGLAAALAAIGYLPTLRWGGQEAVTAMLAGCAISVLASAVGVLPFALWRREATPEGRVNRALGALLLRMAVVLALGAAAAFSGWFERQALLIWLAISYLALLVVDTTFALRVFKGPQATER